MRTRPNPAPSTPLLDLLLALLVFIVAALALYLPADWSGDLRPAPDAVEYAVTAARLARGEPFALPLPGGDAPSRYPFGFPALIAPAYWLPGADLRAGLYGVAFFGAAGAALVFLLGRRIWGIGGGLLAALALLLLPQYAIWHRAVMSETATSTLAAATPFSLWHAVAAATPRRRALTALGAGLAVGIAILVRLNNIVLLPALFIGLLPVLWEEMRQAVESPQGGPRTAPGGGSRRHETRRRGLRTAAPEGQSTSPNSRESSSGYAPSPRMGRGGAERSEAGVRATGDEGRSLLRLTPYALRLFAPALLPPALALLALGLYAWATFGSPLGTGYRYWVPEWYADSRLTFNLAYAFRAPALLGDLNAPLDLPNVAYYARSLTGTLPARTSHFLTTGLCAIAVVGIVAAGRDRRPAARALAGCGAALTALTLLLFAGYFLADVRFLAPLAPLAALAIAGGAITGLRLIRAGLRERRPARSLPRALCGTLIVALAVQALVVAAGPAVAACYRCQRLAGDAAALRGEAPELATIAALRERTAAPSLLVTDLLPPLLGASGLTTGRQVVPLTLGEYWGKAPLRETPPVLDRQRIILKALRDGVPVYLDAYSIAPIARQGGGDIERFLAAHNARLETHYGGGGVTIYRLVSQSR